MIKCNKCEGNTEIGCLWHDENLPIQCPVKRLEQAIINDAKWRNYNNPIPRAYRDVEEFLDTRSAE